MSEHRDIDTIHELLEIMHEHDLDRLKVKVDDATFELVRREPGAQLISIAGGSTGANVAPPTTSGDESSAGPVAPANCKRVLAPLTGVFYRSASPDAESFVNEGDRVNDGDVICILEAMKLFNEIQSDYAGTVVRILPQNGELVSQGEEIFWIAP